MLGFKPRMCYARGWTISFKGITQSAHQAARLATPCPMCKAHPGEPCHNSTPNPTP